MSDQANPVPSGLPPPWKVRFAWWSGGSLEYGRETLVLQGVTIRITSPARAIVDCFRYRNKIGLDIAMEAFSDGLRDRQTTFDEVLRTAQACRAETVIRPYPEMLAR